MPQRTCIVSLGDDACRHPASWLPIASNTIIPFTSNYRAISWLGKHLVYLSVSIPASGIPTFHAALGSGQTLTARTPTALVSMLGITLRDPTPYNGLDAFGFSHPLVQRALWKSFGHLCPLTPPTPVQLPPHLHLQLGDLMRMLQATAAHAAPTARGVERPLSGIDVLAEVASHEAHAGGMAPIGRTSPRAGPPLIRGPR